MCHQRWLVSLALAVALIGGCDKRTDEHAQDTQFASSFRAAAEAAGAGYRAFHGADHRTRRHPASGFHAAH